MNGASHQKLGWRRGRLAGGFVRDENAKVAGETPTNSALRIKIVRNAITTVKTRNPS